MAEKTMSSVSHENGAEPIRNARTQTPRVDVFETEQELLLYADLPGVANNGVDLRYEDGELVLQGKVAGGREGQSLAREFEPADFYRVFRVHDTIDAGKIEAELKNGVLTVHLPKEAKHQPRQVNIKSQA
jgi:HSP20 family protein